jgi:hypothetical protein
MSKVFLIISLKGSPLREQRERERDKEQHKNKELKSSNRFYNDATSVISRKRRIIRR